MRPAAQERTQLASLTESQKGEVEEDIHGDSGPRVNVFKAGVDGRELLRLGRTDDAAAMEL